jgi:hypothetical protein
MKPEDTTAAVAPPFEQGVGRPVPKRAKLSANQLMVLRLACTHGHMTQGCVQQSDYGARTCTIYSLRKRGLLDVMDKPTALGLETFARLKTPNFRASRPTRAAQEQR